MKPEHDIDTARRFGGIARLYGETGFARLQQAHVCVIGIGGVGSWAAEALARSGVGALTLIDLDHVAESNINRQIHADDNTLGQAKIEAMASRIHSYAPDCRLTLVDDFISDENIAQLLPAPDSMDGVIDAIDNVRAKAALIAHCKQNKIALVTTGGAGGRVDPTRVQVDDLSRTIQDALASNVRAKLRKDYGFPRDLKKKFGIDCVFSPEQLKKPANANCAAPQGLSCAGYGSSVAVTSTFGMVAAARMMEKLARE